MNRSLTKCIILAILCGGFQAILFLGMEDDINFSKIVLTFGFSEVFFILVYLTELSIKLLPLILFQIFFGTYIYQHFCSASIYYFSRCQNRVTWFLKECAKLYVFAFIYPIIMVLSGTLVAGISNRIIFDKDSFLLFISYVIIHSLWLFITALLINIIAIILDSSIGFIAVVGLQILSVSTLLLWKNVWPLDDAAHLAKHVLFLKLNPISHLILTWHSSAVTGVNQWINYLQIDFPLNQSIIAFLLVSLVVVIIGCFVVKRKEWITLSKEGGTI